MYCKIIHPTLLDCQRIIKFADKWIGKNYFLKNELEDLLQQSQLNGDMSSILAENEDKENQGE